MCIYIEIKLHTGGLCLIHYVTSEGNWLHLILVRDFTARGVNTYYAQHFSEFLFVNNFENHVIYPHSHQTFRVFCVGALHTTQMSSV